MAGKPVTVEIDTLGFVPLQLGSGYGDPDWAHGQWKGENWAESVVVDLTDPAVVPRIPFGNIDHVGSRLLRRRRGLGLVRAREHRRARAHRVHRPHVRRPVSVVVRSRVGRRRRAGRARRRRPLQRVDHRDGDGAARRRSPTCATDRSVRAVIVAGRGKGFCAGANMTGDDVTPVEAQDRGPVGAIHFIQDNLAQLMLAIHELPQPVIAAVHGAAVGGGLAIALSCDLRVASDDALVRRAVHPGRAVGVRRRQQLLVAARRRAHHRRRAHAHRATVLRRRGAALRHAQPRRRARRAGRHARSSWRG